MNDLIAYRCVWGWQVRDDFSCWRPDAEAEKEIEESEDPESTAIRICDETPMRGWWSA